MELRRQQISRIEEAVHNMFDGDDVAETDPFEPRAEKPQPNYLPSPGEIREECRRIRESWSEHEHWKRAGFPLGKPRWHVQEHRAVSKSLE